MKSRDMAEVEGNSEKKDELQQELDELEERASELDRIRSKNISSVRFSRFYRLYYTFSIF